MKKEGGEGRRKQAEAIGKKLMRIKIYLEYY